MRRAQFTVNAEGVQGNVGAEVTFKCLEGGVWRAWRKNPESDNFDLLLPYTLDWHGFTDDKGNELPSPKDEPDIVLKLYMDEQTKLIRLFLQGPDGESAKN